MRALAVAIALLGFVAAAEAKPRRAKKAVATKPDRSERTERDDRSERSKPSKSKTAKATKSKRTKDSKRAAKKRIAVSSRKERRVIVRGPIEGQSVGAPWGGWLLGAAQLQEGDGWYIRRPYRAFGTDATVGFVQRILADVSDRFPDSHAIAVGDISAEHGGRISDHSSHQSGRDIDIGLIFFERPHGYPHSFVIGTADNLDLEATFVLVEEFANTAQETDGAQMIFLDFEVQGLLYEWALANGENEDYLARLFQYPHGRGASAGFVRHEPNHADHIHVRFRCPSGDSACR